MIRFGIFILIITGIFSCTNSRNNQITSANKKASIRVDSTEHYRIYIPEKQNAILILFPCFPCDAHNTEQEFNIVDVATLNNIAVLMMNFNAHLWLYEKDKKSLEKQIIDALTRNKIETKNIVIGGFSSGGNVTLLLSEYLKTSSSVLQPKGIFIVDSPIDLLGLYNASVLNVQKDKFKIAQEEAQWVVKTFDLEFGIGDSSLEGYENNSPYLAKTHALKNLSHLNDVNIRLYTEPDTAWWNTNRLTDYANTNAYYIEQLAQDLKDLYGEKYVEFIQTTNRGYRANGTRHPHSWAIVDENELVKWILTL